MKYNELRRNRLGESVWRLEKLNRNMPELVTIRKFEGLWPIFDLQTQVQFFAAARVGASSGKFKGITLAAMCSWLQRVQRVCPSVHPVGSITWWNTIPTEYLCVKPENFFRKPFALSMQTPHCLQLSFANTGAKKKGVFSIVYFQLQHLGQKIWIANISKLTTSFPKRLTTGPILRV